MTSRTTDRQRLAMPLPLPIRPASINRPITTISSPLNDCTPPNDIVAQHTPSVVVGNNTRPKTGRIGLGIARAEKGPRTTSGLNSHNRTKMRRGVISPSAARRHISPHPPQQARFPLLDSWQQIGFCLLVASCFQAVSVDSGRNAVSRVKAHAVIRVHSPLMATHAPGNTGLPVCAINQVAIKGVVPPK